MRMPYFRGDTPVLRQSLLVFAEDFGLDLELSRIPQGFGAGIACTDDICGAVSGAIMVIGHRYGRIKTEDIAAKERT